MNTVQKSLLGAAESVETNERRKLATVVDEKKIREDLEEWKRRSMIRAGLAGAATVIAIVGLVA